MLVLCNILKSCVQNLSLNEVNKVTVVVCIEQRYVF